MAYLAGKVYPWDYEDFFPQRVNFKEDLILSSSNSFMFTYLTYCERHADFHINVRQTKSRPRQKKQSEYFWQLSIKLQTVIGIFFPLQTWKSGLSKWKRLQRQNRICLRLHSCILLCEINCNNNLYKMTRYFSRLTPIKFFCTDVENPAHILSNLCFV